MNITFITDTISCKNIYEEIFAKQSFLTYKAIDLSCEFEDATIKTKVVVIDISVLKSIEKLKDFILPKHCFIFLILPFKGNFIPPKNFANRSLHTLEKPLNIKRFYNMLRSVKENVFKLEYLKDKENILINLVDQSPFRIGVYDSHGKLLYANRKYIQANHIENIIKDHYFDELIQCQMDFAKIKYYLKTNEIFTTQKEYQARWYKSYFYYLEDKKTIVHQCSDITSEKIQLDQLQKAAKFFEETKEAVTLTDKNGIIILANKAFCEITGYTMSEAIGQPTSILSSGFHDKNFYENLWDNLRYHGRWQGEIWNKRKNGEIYPEWLSISKIVDYKTDEINYMAIFTDITSLKDADEKLHFYANHDHLTGLINRVQLENMMDYTIKNAQRNQKSFALLFIDLDHFKEVNDTYGHDVGDVVLKEVASRIQKSLRKEDIVARIGGDEFNVVLADLSNDSDAIDVGNNLNDAIKKPIVVDNNSFYLSLSIGVAIYPKHGLDSVTLAKNADQAMYEVKNNDRDGVLLYNSDYSTELLQKITLKNDLKKTIEQEKLEVYYQPVYDLHTHKICGAEALVRWNHPQKGFIPPDQFVLIAENHGMIMQLGEFVIKKVYEDIPMIIETFGKDFTISINMSSKEFAHKLYVDKIIEFTKDFQIDFRNIELEITETYIMQNHIIAAQKLQKLKDAGFGLAIDDFGTGYSSLSYLKKFPIDKLKIDKDFVLNLLEDKSDQAIVKTIIHIADIFNLKVQAEGVESLKHLDMLEQFGCDIAQGFYYCKPIPLKAFLEFKEISNI